MKLLQELIQPSKWLESKALPTAPVYGVFANADLVVEGSLFVAISGSKIEGHQLIPSVVDKASAVIVEQREYLDKYPKTILVASSRKALSEVCSRWWNEPSKAFRLVGVTGTNGKTTTTFLLNEIWRKGRKKSGLVGTISYQLGDEVQPAPLTTPGPIELQKLFAGMRDSGVTDVSMEVSSIALDQARAWGSDFDAVAFTNLTQDHLDYHGTLESYYLSKRKLFTDYGAKVGILNWDDPWGKRLFGESTTPDRLRFSLEDPAAEFFLSSIQYGCQGMSAILECPKGRFPLVTPLFGKHNLLNCLAALASAYALGTEVELALKALAEAVGAPGRLQRVAAGAGRPTIFVDYAHTPDALKNVLLSLHEMRSFFDGRLLTVFGCGGDRDKLKRPAMARVVSALSDVTIATSDNPRTEDPEQILDDLEQGIDRSQTLYLRDSSRRAAIRLALEIAAPSDIVLIAGKGHESYQIVGTETLPFDDAEEVRAFFRGS